MKTTVLAFFVACVRLSSAYISITHFEKTGLERCYDENVQSLRQVSRYSIHGQALPLPNSIETFISLVEKYESLKVNPQPRDTLQKLLQSFRVDNLGSNVKNSREGGHSKQQNDAIRAIFSVPSNFVFDSVENVFTDDEKCALHFMLSHTLNDTKIDEGAAFDERKAKYPIELGVVGVHTNWKHGFALGRVLLGMYAAYLGKEMDASSVLQRTKSDERLDVKFNPVYAVTVGDLISILIRDEDSKMQENGMWDDISCRTEYKLDDNKNGAYVTYSELRGAIDGLIIGKKIQDNPESYANLRLSQILRMYYGYYGLPDDQGTRWCSRERVFKSLTDLESDISNYNKLYRVMSGESPTAQEGIRRAINDISSNVFKDIDSPECSITIGTSIERKFTSLTNVFVIMDYSNTAKMEFQTQVIGNISYDFDIRPRGNLIGVYTNIKSTQSNMLDVIVENNGTAGCPSCFAKYYYKSFSKQDEAELIKDLNATMTDFEEEYDELVQNYQEPKPGSPGKVLLYFNFGSPTKDWRLTDALWELKKYFTGLTILAVGDNKDNLKYFVDNEDLDIFTGSNNAEMLAKNIKQRINKVPGEFLFKECNQSTTSKENENKQVVFISPNKIQYWAMYPQYFLKSFRIKLKFKPQDGTQIRVCFSRWYSSILQTDKNAYCKDSSGEEIEFQTKDPCYRKNVHTCDPFFFSVEAKKPPVTNCESLRCYSQRDIQFEFQHDGISCNTANYAAISQVLLIFAAIILYMQRH